MSSQPTSLGRDQSGKGVIGLLVALIVVGYIGNAAWQVFQVKSKRDKMLDFVEKAVSDAERAHLDAETVRFTLVKKASELGIPLADASAIEVTRGSGRWRVHFEWDDTVKFPGVNQTKHYIIDHTFKIF